MKRTLTAIACILGFAAPASAESPTPEAAFWAWFVENEDRLFRMSADATDPALLRIFNELGPRLRQVDPQLTFEFSSVGEDGTREFIISADGVPEAIPAVHRVHRAAPDLERWEFIAFRQRGRAGDMRWKGELVAHEAVSVALLPSEKPGLVDVLMFLPGVEDRDRNDNFAIMFLLLDNALGEFDVMTKVAYVDVAPPIDGGEREAVSLRDLPARFDALYAALQERAEHDRLTDN